MDKFRKKYRDEVDILLVDDMQFLKRGESVQEEFFHILDDLLNKKKQVVVASDRIPREINGLEDRIKSRLEWGLIAKIEMPDIETRIAILRYKAEKLMVRLPEDVISHVARISKTSIRELEGNLNLLKIYSELQGLPIDGDLAKRVLASSEYQNTTTIEDIQRMVAEYFKIKITDLKGNSRRKEMVRPRQIAMYLIEKHLGKSLTDIGKAFGGRDHTTVINSRERIKDQLASNPDLCKEIDDLTTKIHNINGL
jgi:chromosomal replication initiator protein